MYGKKAVANIEDNLVSRSLTFMIFGVSEKRPAACVPLSVLS